MCPGFFAQTLVSICMQYIDGQTRSEERKGKTDRCEGWNSNVNDTISGLRETKKLMDRQEKISAMHLQKKEKNVI